MSESRWNSRTQLVETVLESIDDTAFHALLYASRGFEEALDALLATAGDVAADRGRLAASAWDAVLSRSQGLEGSGLLPLALLIVARYRPPQDSSAVRGAIHSVQDALNSIRDGNEVGEAFVLYVERNLQQWLADTAARCWSKSALFVDFLYKADIHFGDGCIVLPNDLSFPLDALFEALIGNPAKLMELRRLRPSAIPVQEAYANAFDAAVERSWPELSPLMHHHVLACFRDRDRRLGNWLEIFAPLRWDSALLEQVLEEVERRSRLQYGFSDGRSLFDYLTDLKHFTVWTKAGADVLLRMIDRNSATARDWHLDLLKHALAHGETMAASDRNAVALAYLDLERLRFVEGRASVHDEERLSKAIALVRSLGCGGNADWLVDRWHRLPQLWGQLGPDERALWQAEILERLRNEPDLRRGLLEFVLRRAQKHHYQDLQALVRGLAGNTGDMDAAFLHLLARHSDPLVAMRAMALLEARFPGPLSAVLAATAPPSDIMEAGQSTWIGDGETERVIYYAAREEERRLCRSFEDTWRADEEHHLSDLLGRLAGRFSSLGNDVRGGSAHGWRHPPRIDFAYRAISKREEGAAGVGTKRFSADVCFMVTVLERGRVVARRATYVQGKKLEKAGSSWKQSFDYDPDQATDLVAQTDSSFYLFVAPTSKTESLLIVPARLVRNLASLEERTTTLPFSALRPASRTFSQWLTYDLLGLWTGDERSNVVAKAEGTEPGWAPRLLVTITIDRYPPDRDDRARR